MVADDRLSYMEIAAFRRGGFRLFKRKFGGSKFQGGAADQLRLVDLLAVDERPIATFSIFDPPGVVAEVNRGVNA